MIQIHDNFFEIYIEENEVQDAVQQVAQQINLNYFSKDVLLVCVLNGSFMFTADLMKNLTVRSEVTFVKYKSYEGTESTGEVKEIMGIQVPIKDKEIIIVEDIVDTGQTLSHIYKVLQKHQPKSIKTATLLYKPKAYKGTLPIDYVGKEIPNDFVVGYGLDYDEQGRHLPAIYKLKD